MSLLKRSHRPPKWLGRGRAIGMVQGIMDPNVVFSDTRKRKKRLPRIWANAEAFEQEVRADKPRAQERLAQDVAYIVRYRLKEYYEKYPKSKIHFDDAYGLLFRRIMGRYITAVKRIGLNRATYILRYRLAGLKTIRELLKHAPLAERPGHNIFPIRKGMVTQPLRSAANVEAPDTIHQHEQKKILLAILERTKLTPTQEHAIRGVFGFDGPPKTLANIGVENGRTREAVRKAHLTAIEKLKTSARIIEAESEQVIKRARILAAHAQAAKLRSASIPKQPVLPITAKPRALSPTTKAISTPVIANSPRSEAKKNPPATPAKSIAKPSRVRAPKEPKQKPKPLAVERAPKPKKEKKERVPRAKVKKKKATPKTSLQKAFSKMNPTEKLVVIQFIVKEIPIEAIAARLKLAPRDTTRILETAIKRMKPEAYAQLSRLKPNQRSQ